MLQELIQNKSQLTHTIHYQINVNNMEWFDKSIINSVFMEQGFSVSC